MLAVMLFKDPTTEQFGGFETKGMVENSNVKLVKWDGWFNYCSKRLMNKLKAITTADSMLDTVNRLKKLIIAFNQKLWI